VSKDEGRVISLAERRAQTERQKAKAVRAQARQQARIGEAGPASKPWLTWTLIGLNAAVWLVMVALGVDAYEPKADVLHRWGGNFGIATANGQWWRLLTAMFLHAGIIHLGFNLYFLWMVGRHTERIFGRVGYAIVYLGSGLFAGLVAVAWEPAALRVGASGALFGVFGAFLAFTFQRRDALPPDYVKGVRRNALILIVISLVMGLTLPNIGLVDHIAGLVGGLGIGYSIARLAERVVTTPAEARAVKLRSIGLTAGATIVILLAGAFALPSWDDPRPVLDDAEAKREEVRAEYQAKRSDVEARIESLEQRVLPALREAHAELAALDRLPGEFAGVVADCERLYEQEIHAYERELEGLRTGDPLTLADADELHRDVAKRRGE
jgi:rhomboid protease GluP